MLTFDQAMRIVVGSARTVAQDPTIGANSTLGDCGLFDYGQFNVFLNYVVHEVEGSGYRIQKSRLRSLDRHLMIQDVAQIIQLFSLPGDDTFEEPPDDEEESASSE